MATKGTYARKREYSAGAGKFAKKNDQKFTILAACAVVAVVIIVLVIGYFSFYNSIGDTILNNVTVAGVDVGGMTKKQALAAVQQATQNSYSNSNMVVEAFGETLVLTPEETQVYLDAEGAVEEAYNYGRTGFVTKWQKERLEANTVGYAVDLTPYFSINSDAIKSAVNEFLKDKYSELKQSSWKVTGDRPNLTKKTEEGGQVLTIHIGTPSYMCNAESLYEQIMAAYSENRFQFTAECETVLPEAIDLLSIWETYTVLPVDAVQDPETFAITKEMYGYGFDLDSAMAQIKDAEYGSTVEIVFEYLEPSITEETIAQNLFGDKLATYTAYQNSDSNRATNLYLACMSIDGLVLNPGEVFSYNKTLGERTEEKGYRPGAAYVGNTTEALIGGGICQVATTMYYCALYSDLEILERECHQFATVYSPLGVDATVSYGWLDFRFRNNTDHPILIKASASGGSTTVTFYGTDDKDYYIDIESVVLERYDPETEYVDKTAEGIPEGEVITTSYTGYKVATYRCKYDKETKELISRTYEDTSKYSVRNKVVCKVEEATDPSDSTGDSSSETEDTSGSTDSSETTESTPSSGSGGDISDGGGALPEE